MGEEIYPSEGSATLRILNRAVRAAALVVVTVGLLPGQARAQADRFVQIPVDPAMPHAEGFDTERVLLWAEPNFIPFRDPEWQPLRDARRANSVGDDTPVVLFEAGGQTLVLVTSQMSYHHVAQGEMAGEPWMVTF